MLSKALFKKHITVNIRWTTKEEKLPEVTPKPEIDENGLSKGMKPDYIKPFQHLFEKKNIDKLPMCRKWDHEINLTDNAPPSLPTKTYRMTPVEHDTLDQFIADELKAGKIQESKLPYASPCFFIAKKDGSRCLVQDYQKVNAFMIKDKTLLPRSLMCSKTVNYSQRWILSGDTTMYKLKRDTNGKPPSLHQRDSLN